MMSGYDAVDFCRDADVSRETCERLQLFAKLLKRWIARINLVSRASMDDLWLRHMADSAQLRDVIPKYDGALVDVGSGAGIDSLIAARMTGAQGKVVGVDMTPEMRERARNAAAEAGLANVEFRDGYAESLPVPDGWADVVISNGVLNLVPDKSAALGAMYRVLKPGGRLQIGDILVQVQVPEEAKLEIDLWTG